MLGERKDVLWLDYDQPDPRDSPDSISFHKRFHHRFVAHIPMVENDETIGFLALAWDKRDEVQPDTAKLDLCRQLASRAVVAVQLTRLAVESRAAVVNEERRVAALARAIELEQANELLLRRDRLLKALTEASTLQLMTPGPPPAILESFTLLAEAGDFHRAGILKNVDASGRPGFGYWAVLFEWAVVGYIQQKKTSFATMAWRDLDPTGDFISQLAQGVVVDGQRVETEGEQTKLMETIDALYTINAPIFVGGVFFGACWPWMTVSVRAFAATETLCNPGGGSDDGTGYRSSRCSSSTNPLRTPADDRT